MRRDYMNRAYLDRGSNHRLMQKISDWTGNTSLFEYEGDESPMEWYVDHGHRKSNMLGTVGIGI